MQWERSGENQHKIYSKNIFPALLTCPGHTAISDHHLFRTQNEKQFLSLWFMFHPSDSCWIVLHSQSCCLHLHFPRNYYPGLNWKWRSSYFSLFPRHFGIWSMTVYLKPDGGQCSTFTLPCSVTWNFVPTVSGHRIRLPTSCFQVHSFLPKAFISILEIRLVGDHRDKALSHHGLIMYPFQEWCLRKVLCVLGELQTSSDIGHQRRVSWGNGTEPGERQELGKKSGRLYMTGLIHSFNTQHTSTEYPLYAKGYSEKRPR